MRHIVIEETMYDMDKNKDGKITLEEYISESANDITLDHQYHIAIFGTQSSCLQQACVCNPLHTHVTTIAENQKL